MASPLCYLRTVCVVTYFVRITPVEFARHQSGAGYAGPASLSKHVNRLPKASFSFIRLMQKSPLPLRHHDANVLFEINGLKLTRLVMVLDKGFWPLPFAVQGCKRHPKRYPLAQ